MITFLWKKARESAWDEGSTGDSQNYSRITWWEIYLRSHNKSRLPGLPVRSAAMETSHTSCFFMFPSSKSKSHMSIKLAELAQVLCPGCKKREELSSDSDILAGRPYPIGIFSNTEKLGRRWWGDRPLVSRPACKQPRSCHSLLLRSKELKHWKINNSPWICQGSEMTRKTTAPKIRETERQTQRITTYQSKNPWTETSKGTSVRRGKTELQMMDSWRLKCRQYGDFKTLGGLVFRSMVAWLRWLKTCHIRRDLRWWRERSLKPLLKNTTEQLRSNGGNPQWHSLSWEIHTLKENTRRLENGCGVGKRMGEEGGRRAEIGLWKATQG